MSRIYTGLWRALMILDDGTDRDVIMHTEPPETYEEVERYLWKTGMQGLPVEGMRLKKALMVRVAD